MGRRKYIIPISNNNIRNSLAYVLGILGGLSFFYFVTSSFNLLSFIYLLVGIFGIMFMLLLSVYKMEVGR